MTITETKGTTGEKSKIFRVVSLELDGLTSEYGTALLQQNRDSLSLEFNATEYADTIPDNTAYKKSSRACAIFKDEISKLNYFFLKKAKIIMCVNAT